MLSHTGHVMTLANSIIGVGILAMPFCFQKCGIFLSIVLLIVSNWITRICCHYIIKSSLLTRRKSFEFLGFHAFGSSGKLLVELCIIGYLLGTCITYFVVVGDIGPQILTKIFIFDGSHENLRTYFMFVITLLFILPLAMLKNVDSLAAVCTASIGFYVCLVIKIILESETHILANDWTNQVEYWQPAGVLQCLPIFSMALSCQMQLFEVFKSVNNQSVEKLNGIVRDATWLCTFVYIAVGFFGYVAFCTQAFSGNILMNFSPSFGSDVIKIGFILSVAFSFPLVIFPCRASIYSLLYRKGHTDATGGYIPETRFKTITSFIVGFTLCVALVIPSVELIIGLVGSTIGVAICIMFPAACFRKITKKHSNDRSYTLSGIILIGGFCLMVLGTYANLQAIDEHSSGSHLEISNVQKNIISRPTDLPVIKKEVQNLLNENSIIGEKKFLKQENSKLPQEEEKKIENLNEIVLQKNEILDKIIMSSTMLSVAPPPPPQAPVLPIDEPHDENIKQLPDKVVELKLKPPQVDKNEVVKVEAINPIESLNNITNENVILAPPQLPLPQPRVSVEKKLEAKELNNLISSEISLTLQQTIDKDAIKKDEEIAAEEQKNNKEDELKKTQNELKKTKELLERKVDEMKEELAKQNKETQDLVVEKLEEVVEKVEKIERQVQKKDEQEIEKFKPEQKQIRETQDLVAEKLEEVAEKVEKIERQVQKQDERENEKSQPKQEQIKETQDLVAEKLEEMVKKVEKIERHVQKKDEREIEKFKPEQKQVRETQDLVAEKLEEVAEKVEKIERQVQKQDEREQFKETQDLVAEKLEEMVKKVEKIEREVQKQDERAIEKEKLDPQQIKENLDKKPLLLSKLTEASMPLKNEVYEPLSYKTGELIQHSFNGNKLEQHLPLPLPLLINASRIQANDIKIEEQPKIELFKPQQINEASKSLLPPKNQILPQKPPNISNPVQRKADDNIEAIRRDILQLKNDQIPTTDHFQHRLKRSLDLEAIETKLTKENCLKEPKIETLLQHGASDALEVKIQGIGRDLKSLKDKDNEKS